MVDGEQADQLELPLGEVDEIKYGIPDRKVVRLPNGQLDVIPRQTPNASTRLQEVERAIQATHSREV